VIRVPRLPVGQNDHPRPQPAQHGDDLQPVLPGIFDAAVGQIERLAPADLEDAGGGRRLLCPLPGRAPRAGLAAGQVEDPGLEAEGAHLQQGAAAGLLHIIAMGGDGQDVDEARLLRHPARSPQ
jgi:hypothetical protein